jgi:hypothetical protein
MTVRHLDTGIVGHVIAAFRHRGPSGDGHDFVTVKWSGGGIVTDEPAFKVAEHVVDQAKAA